MWRLTLLLVVLTGCWSGSQAPSTGPKGHSPPEQSAAQPVAIPVNKLSTGEVLFLRHCAGCHGDGPVATVLGLRPRNLRQAGLFSEDRDPDWINRILHGRAMPVSVQSSQTTAIEKEVDELTRHLRRLPTLPWADIDRGEDVYDSLCLSCHGVYGHGDGPVASTLPVRPRDLLTPPYQQQVTDEILFQRISDGHGAMPLGLAFPGARRRLSSR